jgi:hypothetical protein
MVNSNFSAFYRNFVAKNPWGLMPWLISSLDHVHHQWIWSIVFTSPSPMYLASLVIEAFQWAKSTTAYSYETNIKFEKCI